MNDLPDTFLTPDQAEAFNANLAPIGLRRDELCKLDLLKLESMFIAGCRFALHELAIDMSKP